MVYKLNPGDSSGEWIDDEKDDGCVNESRWTLSPSDWRSISVAFFTQRDVSCGVVNNVDALFKAPVVYL